jgi:hypothetical protein
MAAFGNMMQQQPQQQGQAPEAMQPQPQFGGGQLPPEMRGTGFTNHAYGGPYGKRY